MANQEHRYSVLTRVGAGTPMGELMRQYWVPAIMSDELAADGDPVRVKLLGEELIAFRTTSGKVGLMDQRCPHRVASLFYGRNEEDGIRCVYHGWKFAADGTCVDQGNVPVEQQFCSRTPAKAYPTREQAGIVFAYLGHAAKLPEIPDLPVFNANETVIQCVMHECNWLQRLEGDIDTSHAGFLHAESRDKIATLDTKANPQFIMFTNPRPDYKVADTEYGTIYGAYRPADETHDYWRIGHYLFPFYTMAGAPPLGSVNVTATIPMDDGHIMRFSIRSRASSERRLQADPLAKELGAVRLPEYLPNTTGWYGRWRRAENARNDYLIDREKQRHGGSYTGIRGVGTQDTAVTESMGPVVDHSWENLAPSDLMIVRTRQRILNILDDAAKGIVPPGVADAGIYHGITGGFANLPKDKDWLQGYADHTKHVVRPAQHAAA